MAILLNTLLRLALIGASAGLLAWAGMRGPVLWASAVLAGFLLAFIFFRGPADAAAQQVARIARRAPRGGSKEKPASQQEGEGELE